MSNYVVTGLSEEYWHHWGESWIISLKELGRHDLSKAIIFDFGLSASSLNKIKKFNVNIIPAQFRHDIRSDSLIAIADLKKEEKDIFAYWDVDCYFNDEIQSIFDLVDNNFLVTKNHDAGFIAGNSSQWRYISDIHNFNTFLNDPNHLYNFLLNYLRKFTLEISNEWNHTDIPSLFYNNLKPKVVHPVGSMKKSLVGKNLLFWEKHQDLYNQFSNKRFKTLFKKK